MPFLLYYTETNIMPDNRPSLPLKVLGPVRQFVSVTLVVAILVIALSVTLYWRAKNILELQIKERLMRIAAVSAMQFDGKDLQRIKLNGDYTGKEYTQTIETLARIKRTIPEVQFAYILAKTEDPEKLVFLADGAAALSEEELDTNRNDYIDIDESPSYPGDPYDISQAPAMLNAFDQPAVDEEPTEDQWGMAISGYAPILRSDTGEAVAIIGLDMQAEEFIFRSQSVLSPVVFSLLLVATGLITSYLVYVFTKKRLEEWQKLDRERAGLMLLTYHQLGGPLTIFKWATESLLTRPKDMSTEDAITEHVQSMHAGIERMDQMLSDLREAAQVQEGRVEVAPKLIRVDEVLRHTMEEVQDRAKIKGISLDADLEQHMHFMIDRPILSSVTRQLLLNSLAFTPRNGHVQLNAHKAGKNIYVEIRDNGSGIAKSDMPRLFQKFTRGENAPRYQPDGNGLGLFIARGLVEAAGGDLHLTSTEGKGTTVYFTLPIE